MVNNDKMLSDFLGGILPYNYIYHVRDVLDMNGSGKGMEGKKKIFMG